MSNLLDRFNKMAVGSKGRISDYTARISAKGDFSRVDDIQAILSSWNNILLTPLRSYVFDPTYGSELYKYVFEPADSETAEAIKDEINYRLGLFDDRATVESIDIAFLRNYKGFTFNITAKYEGEVAELSAKIDESIYFNFTRVE